tara:strand:- start:231 stop:605 length:375 start_codon:yes stop_codon:yes gene_type:complete
MGRYYSGDIEGKFMFSVQSSDDADFFGSEGHTSYLNYHFDKDDHMTSIDKGIIKCKIALGSWKKKLDTFFKKNDGWNDKMLWDQIRLSSEKSKEILGWYARLELGEKIKKCVKENGDCSFEAEL